MGKGWGSERFLSYTGGGGNEVFWWSGEYSADDNTVRTGLLNTHHSINIME